jgi:antirestriction protein ArdC
MQHRTLFHELAHVVLGHTEELRRMDDTDRTPQNLREVEAESVALICCESLGMPGSDFCRGYVQHWIKGESITDKSAQCIFKAADQIPKAGHPQKAIE